MKLFKILFAFLMAVLPLSALAQGKTQDRVDFMDIPLGTDNNVFVKKLRSSGFKVLRKTEKTDIDDAYATFLGGTMFGNPAIIHLKASAPKGPVFSAELIVRQFIDLDEAVDESERFLSMEWAKYPNAKIDTDHLVGNVANIITQVPTMSTLIELPNAKGERKLVLAETKLKCILRIYDTIQQENNYDFGNITYSIYKLLNGPEEYVLSVSHYDRNVAGNNVKH